MFEYINKTYGLNVKKGMRVIAQNRPGIVVADRGHYVGIRLDGIKEIYNYHPTDGIEYLATQAMEKQNG